MSIPYLYMLVGLPGSGKSTWAEQHVDENTIWLSSDILREEILGDVNDQSKHGIIFEAMNKRTIQLLKDGKNVIYDATNLSSKRRIGLIKQINHIECKKKCIIIASDIMNCISYDLNRNRTVGSRVIENKLKIFQIPMYHEGWDDITIYQTLSNRDIHLEEQNIIENLLNVIDYSDYEYILSRDSNFKRNIDLAQDNPYHTLSVSRHMYHTYKNINTDNKYLKIAALLHDVGKCYCKNFKEGSKYANFISHDNVSAYNAMIYLLRDKTITGDEIIKICTYIQLHMRVLQLKDNPYKFVDLVGESLYSDLLTLSNADKSAK